MPTFFCEENNNYGCIFHLQLFTTGVQIREMSKSSMEAHGRQRRRFVWPQSVWLNGIMWGGGCQALWLPLRQEISATGSTDVMTRVLLQSVTSISRLSVEMLPTFLLISAYSDIQKRGSVSSACAVFGEQWIRGDLCQPIFQMPFPRLKIQL